MSSYTDTGDNLQVTSGNLVSGSVMSVYKKTFTANSTVTLGGNGGAGGAFYLTFVKPLSSQTLPSVSVTATDAAATENADTGTFTLTRTGATTPALMVNFSISGSATNGTDYTTLGSTLVIPAGQSSATITINTINDSALESTETVVLTLTVNAAYNLGTPSTAAVSIADDDSPPLPVVSVIDSDPSCRRAEQHGQLHFHAHWQHYECLDRKFQS